MANVRPDRPRLWVNNDTLPALKVRAAAGDPRYLAWKSMVDTHMSPDWDRGCVNHSLAYVMTGDPSYAQVAITLIMAAGTGTGAVSGDSGYPVRTLLPSAAIVYDYCAPVLTAAQKTQLRTAIENWAMWVWPETNPSRAGAWGVDSPGNNYYNGFLIGTWMGALALYGDSPLASNLLSVSLNRHTTGTLPYLAGWGKGGHWPEDGTSYGAESTTLLFQAWEAHRTATGEDFFASQPWAAQAVSAAIHTTSPDKTCRWPFGDQTRASMGYLDDMDRGGMLVATRFDNRAAPWCDTVTPARNQQRINMWQDFAFYHAAVPA